MTSTRVVTSPAADETELASNQRLIWIGQQLHRGDPLYETTYRYTIRGRIDPVRFGDAFKRLVDQTEVLRVVASDENWTQPVVRSTRDVECPLADLSSHSNPQAAADQLIDRRLAERFRCTDSLCDATLIRLAPDHWECCVTIHHALTDAFSGRALLSNLARLYESQSADGTVPEIHDYRQFVQIDAQAAVDESTLEHRKWFLDRSKPTDGSRFYSGSVPVRSVRHTRVVVRLRDEENAAIGRLSMTAPFRQITPRLSNFNLFATIMVAWLSRIQTRDEICLGATTHGRVNANFRDTIGLFMQLLPFRVSVVPGETFESLGRKVATESMGFLQHARAAVMTPESQRAFDVALNVIDLTVDDFCGMPTSMDWLHNGFGDPHRSLTISAHCRAGGQWELLFDFSDSAFSPVDRQRAIDHFRKTLNAIDASAATLISEFDLLTESDRAFLSRYCGTMSQVEAVNIWDKFLDQCRRYRDVVAVSGTKHQLTYGALRLMSEALADQIETTNCGDVVPIVCRRDERAVIAMLGVLASGRCFLVIDAANPAARVDKLLGQCDAKWMVDAVGDEVGIRAVSLPGARTCDLTSGACYVLFTSGSTGRPNGVVVDHGSLWNLLLAFEELAPLPAGCRCSWWTNVGFDVAIYEVFSALLFGRTLCIPSEEQRLDSAEMLRWMQESNIESAYLPPFFLEATDRLLSDGGELQLKRLLVGVEPIPQRLLASIARQRPDLNLINGYGPTETTVCATLHRIDPKEDSDGAASIGTPVAGNVIRVVDPSGHDVPPGVIGELWIGGAGVARGYLSNPELTQRRFTAAMLSGESTVWYRSGDRVRMRHDGTLQFIGRLDDQIKLAGVRIEPTEIAACARQCDGVDDCLILPLSTNGQVDRLVALVEGNSGVDADRVRRHLRARLAPAMVPSRFIIQRRFPRTANGKIDRASLAALLADQSAAAEQSDDTASPMVAPTNAFEFALVRIICDVLGHKSISTDADFFELGGSSLDAMNVVAKANELEISIAVADVFRYRTVRDLVGAYSRPSQHQPRLRETEPSEVGLSSQQKAIWYYCQLHPDSSAYHFQVRWEADGRIDAEIAEQCWEQLSRQHPALRTTIEPQDGRPAPRVHHELAPSLTIWDHGATAEEIVAEAKRPFDLSNDSPLRVLHVQPPDHYDTLAVTVHHIAVDQHSVALLMSQFADLYRTLSEKTGRAPFGVGDRQCGAVAPGSDVRRPAAGDAASFEWWRTRLEHCDREVALPVDFETPASESDAGALLRFELPTTLGQSVRRSATACGVSPGTFLMAAFGVLVARYAASEQFAVGIPVSLRSGDSHDEQVGCLVEALPFACCVNPDVDFRRLVDQLQDDFADLLDHSGTSQQWLSEHFGSLFNIMYVPQQPLGSIHLADGLELRPVVSDLGSAKFDLTWFVADAKDRIECAVEYRTTRFKRETIELIIRHWQSLLERLAEDPNQPVGQIDFRTDGDHAARRLLAGDSAGAVIDPSVETICPLIASMADQQPDSVAVVFADETVSYRQLMERVRNLSDQLRFVGVRPDVPVALCVPRSVEMIVAILGILEAGGAYVPFDPNLSHESMSAAAQRARVDIAVGAPEDLVDVFQTVLDPKVRSVADQDVAAGSESPDEESLAYVLHTSGSTGRPKGVEVNHGALLRSTLARNAFYETAPRGFLMVSPVWFDSSVAGIFWTLATGGTLVLPRDEELQDVQQMAALIDRNKVTEVLLLPSLYHLLTVHADASRLNSLERVIVAGESCSLPIVRQHFRVLPHTRLFNEYGPTEASVWATAQELTASDDLVAIGRSVAGTPVTLLDAHGVPAPIGAIGEIHIGGPRLAIGYRCDEDATQQKFVADPSSEGSGRLYRTGDLARMRVDGTLIYLGRNDDQIKVNGVRVEPAEIESALVSIPGVMDAAVAMMPRNSFPIADQVDDLVAALEKVPEHEAMRMLEQARQINTKASETISAEDEHVRIAIEVKDHDFLKTPRSRQRKWLLEQTLRETASDLAALDSIADRLVPGSDDPHLPRDLSLDRLTPQEIMEDWQTPLMRAMAQWVTESHGDVLEIGFGRGVAATMIQDHGVRSHTVVEMNPHSIKDHFEPWRNRHAEQDIRLVPGRWQDNLDEFRSYDGILFHAFPMNEAEFVDYVANSATFAEHFFPVASKLLRTGGVFTYLTTEIDSLSRRHQRSLFEHFSEIHQKIQSLSVPEDTKDAWWADTMVVVRAVK